MNWTLSPRMLKAETMQRCKLRQCQAACCLHGVWAGMDEVEKIMQYSYQISPHMRENQQNPQNWFGEEQEIDSFVPGGVAIHTTVLEDPKHWGGTACVFLRADHKCALQVAAVSAGLHPWHYKPFYCILHPLDLDDQGRITLDHSDTLLDEPGSCLRPANQPIPLLLTFEEELRYFLGDEQYDSLRAQYTPDSD